MQGIKNILQDKDEIKKQFIERHKYVSKEFQDYGYRLALKLDDLTRVSMYIRLAKNKPRTILEKAFSFAIDYPNAKNKGRLFLWKIKEIEDEIKNKCGSEEMINETKIDKKANSEVKKENNIKKEMKIPKINSRKLLAKVSTTKKNNKNKAHSKGQAVNKIQSTNKNKLKEANINDGQIFMPS